MEFDEFINVILWSVHCSCIPLLSYEGFGSSSKNVEKILLKSQKTSFWHYLKENLVWFHFNLNEFISGRCFIIRTERSYQNKAFHNYESEQKHFNKLNLDLI